MKNISTWDSVMKEDPIFSKRGSENSSRKVGPNPYLENSRKSYRKLETLHSTLSY